MVRVSVPFIVLASFLSTALTVMNAFFLKKQFYPSVVYLTKSSTSMAVLYFQAAVISYLVFSMIRWIFFGQLRAAEIEHAQERVWHAIMETCLAFTVFRDDFSPKFVIQFVVLFFVKAFHWLAEDRVDYMERSPVITLTFHARILGIISLLSAIDSYFISHAFFTTLMRGASAQIVFGFEYAVLLTCIAHITISYILHLHDLRSPHPWENKAVYMLYAELLTSFLRCALYLAFAVVMMKIHTFPLFAIRPFYMTLRAFRKAVNDVILSRRAINAMNNLFPLATAQDLAESDNTCIICREEMTVEAGVKKLPCNHIFHPNCLRSWFQRQQTCPTCRTDVLVNRRPPIIPGQQQQPGQPQQQPQQFVGNNIMHPFQFQFHFQPRGPVPQQQQMPPPQFMPPQQFGFPPFPGGFAPPQFMGQQVPPQQQIPVQPQAQQTPMAATLANGGPAMGAAAAGEEGEVQQANGQSAGQQPTTTTQTSNGQQQQQQGQQQTNGGPSTEGTTNNHPTVDGTQQQQQTAQSQPSVQSQIPAFFSPFMMFPPSPFGPGAPYFMPPPPPPFLPFPQRPTMAGLSDAELAEMEGTERRVVEARIQTLRNIQVLLDAAMLQFQQYLTAVPAPTTSGNMSSNENRQQASTNLTPTSSTAAGPSTTASNNNNSPNAESTTTTTTANGSAQTGIGASTSAAMATTDS